MNTGARSSLAGRLRAQLDTWPALSLGLADCGVGTGFTNVTHRAGGQIVHLHGGDEAELCLTWPVVARLSNALRRSGRVTLVPGCDWVRVRLDTEFDVELAISLASVAIQANTPDAEHPVCQSAVLRPRASEAVNGALRVRR
ncbi:MAG: luciferase family protein [Gaiellaceae bacterium]